VTEENEGSAGQGGLDVGALVHSSAGIISLVAGGLMYTYGWALALFSGLMILSAVSAVLISWRDDAWVPGHWLAMLPVLGVGAGYFGIEGGYTFAYICLWIAFAHFVIRGVQTMRAAKGEAAGD